MVKESLNNVELDSDVSITGRTIQAFSGLTLYHKMIITKCYKQGWAGLQFIRSLRLYKITITYQFQAI